MKIVKKGFTVLLCVLITLSSCFFMAYASVEAGNISVPEENAPAEEQETTEKETSVKAIAHNGDWTDAPENSLKSVVSCNCVYVSVDIQVTSDGVPVLMEDDTVDRTCVDEKGEPVSGKVSDFTAEELCKFYLRNRNGGTHNKKTDELVSKLSDVLASTSGKTLILDFSLSDLDAVYTTVYDAQAQNRVMFRINGKREDVISALKDKTNIPETIITYNGNIIFGVNSTVKDINKSGFHFVQLGTTNQYGVIFYNSVKKKINEGNLNAVFSMTDGNNAKRSDSPEGWDDVISHGFSYIETNNVDFLNDYINSSEATKSKLRILTDKKTEYENGVYPKQLKKEYDKALANAEMVLTNVSSLDMLIQAYNQLNNAMNQLNLSEGTTTVPYTFSAGRVVAAVLCLAAAAAAQVYFFKRRKKD